MTSFNNISAPYDNLQKHWKTDLILDINLCNDTQSENIWTTDFLGTVDGCECNSNISNNGVEVLRGNCTKSQIKNGCISVKSISSTKLVKWSDSSLFCVKRLEDSSFEKIYQNSDINGTCLANSLKCGGSELSQSVCLNNTDKCPISEIVISNFNPDEKIYTENITSGNTTIFISRDSGSYPMVDLLASEFKLCLNRMLASITPGRTNYPLNLINRTVCSEDTRFHSISSCGERSLFEANNLSLVSLPDFNLSNAYIHSRFKRNLIPWKSACASKLNGFFSQSYTLSTLYSLQKVLYGFSIIYACLMSLLTLIRWTFEVKKRRRWTLFYFIYAPINIVMFIAIGIPAAKSLASVGYFKHIYSDSCSDEFTNKTMEWTGDHLRNKVLDYNLYMLGFFFVGIIFEANRLVVDCIFNGRRGMQISTVETLLSNRKMITESDEYYPEAGGSFN